MKETERTNYAHRHGIMNEPSDEDAASIGASQAGDWLYEGDEYVDLNQLDSSVFDQGSDR